MQHYKSGTIFHRIVISNDIVAIAAFFEKMVQQYGGKNVFTAKFCDSSSVTAAYAHNPRGLENTGLFDF